MENLICDIITNEKLSREVYLLKVKTNVNINPGQFFMIRSMSNEMFLSRPISVCEIEENIVSFAYIVKGEGTKALSRLKTGNSVSLLGPSGNGFKIDEIQGNVALVSGGIGIAPFVELSKKMNNKSTTLFAGFRDETYLLDKFNVDKIVISTESGRIGNKGYVTDNIDFLGFDLVICCGPEILMNKVIKVCKEKKIKSFVSTEKHMACGIGACLVCSCKTVYGNLRCCVDGPVFNGEDLIIE